MRWLFVLFLIAAVGCSGSSDTKPPAADPTPPADSAPGSAPGPAPADDTPGATGTSGISGTVTYDGKVPQLKPVKMNADPGCAKKHADDVMPEVLVLGEGNTLGNIFVRVKSGLPGGRYAPPAEPVVLDQVGCRYTPHVTGVMVDQPFKVLNSDGLLHNVHSLSKINQSFNRAMPPAVTEVDYTFTKEEILFKIKCDVHPWMSAYVAVVSHPFFAVTAPDGRFEISGLPAGSYEIEAWHEKLGTRSATVEVADGAVETLDFTFSM